VTSRFFIDRPIFASVLSIIIVVVGLVAMKALPISQFPEITPPVVQIDADYPGANAEVVADSVARPIEVQLPGIDNLLYYDSTSTNDGHMTVKLTFEIGTNIDIAQVQTQNRVKLAEPQIPNEVIRQGISVKKTSPDLLAVVALSSSDPRYDMLYLSNYAIINVLDGVKRLRGVGDAAVFGVRRFWEKPNHMLAKLLQLRGEPRRFHEDFANAVDGGVWFFLGLAAGLIGQHQLRSCWVATRDRNLQYSDQTRERELTEVRPNRDEVAERLPFERSSVVWRCGWKCGRAERVLDVLHQVVQAGIVAGVGVIHRHRNRTSQSIECESEGSICTQLAVRGSIGCSHQCGAQGRVYQVCKIDLFIIRVRTRIVQYEAGGHADRPFAVYNSDFQQAEGSEQVQRVRGSADTGGG